MSEVYNPKNVNTVVDGVIVTGYQDGTMVQCARSNDKFSMDVGSQGDVTFVENADDTGTITVTVKHTSPTASYLMSKAKSKTPFPVQVIDSNNGNFKAGGSEALVQRSPDVERSNEVSGLEFAFLVADYDTQMN